jgi:site-specific DNA-methyltransferase (adenine-specific)
MHEEKYMPIKREEIIGDARLLLGDCLEIMPTLGKVDLAIVDPPYFDGPQKDGYYTGTKQTAGTINYGTIETWDIPDDKYITQLVNISENQIIWGINYFDVALPGGRIVWIKADQETPFSQADIAYHSFYNRIDVFKCLWSGFWKDKMTNKEERIHPTQKPVALYRWLLKNYAKEGDHILDTHGGSMSSVIACLEMGFKITCIEIDEDYFNAGCERVRQAQRQGKLFTPPKPKPEERKLF